MSRHLVTVFGVGTVCRLHVLLVVTSLLLHVYDIMNLTGMMLNQGHSFRMLEKVKVFGVVIRFFGAC